MLVIADSSPIIALINTGRVDLLPALFGEVVIPPEVSAELHAFRRDVSVPAFMADRPAWLVERTPSVVELIHHLHPGELAAISLARELNADLLLIDELDGRRAATERHIPITGTVGVLEFAADRGLVDLRIAFEQLKSTGFWIAPALLDQRLKMWFDRRKS